VLEAAHRAGYFDGDLLLFFADKKQGAYRLPDAWKPHVSGEIEVHTIHCKHFEMTEPVPLKEIGRILEQRLKQISNRRINHDEPIRK